MLRSPTVKSSRPLAAPTSDWASTSDWDRLSSKQRCRIIGRVPQRITESFDAIAAAFTLPQRTSAVETLVAEVLPLCDACAYLAKSGPRILKSQKVGRWQRPLWLLGVRSEVHRVPFGKVLIIGAWNYPLLLCGVQAAQALVAGNEVLWKPAPGCEQATIKLAECFWDAGVDRDHLRVLDSSPSAAAQAIEEGVDLIVLTGSATTGRAIMRLAAETLTPCILELSGSDACVVFPEADPQLVARAIRFGVTINSGATCIAPRRIFAAESIAGELRTALINEFHNLPLMDVHPAARSSAVQLIDQAMQFGAHDLCDRFQLATLSEQGKMPPTIFASITDAMELSGADVFAPVSTFHPWSDPQQVVSQINDCAYGLGVSLFGETKECQSFARQLQVGGVIVNDLIAPTADARLPFGGRRKSGYGVTRGREGLLAMTQPQVITTRYHGPYEHLRPFDDSMEAILRGTLQLQYAGGLSKRLKGISILGNGIRKKIKRSNGKGSGQT